jgi:hypothetical protein
MKTYLSGYVFFCHKVKVNLIVFALLNLSLVERSEAGNGTFCKADTVIEKRMKIAAGTTSLIGVTSLTGLASVWYHNDKNGFHTFNDVGEWKQMDKFGHIASTYNTSLIITDLYKWAGVREKESRMIGSALSFSYMSIVEVMDGYSSGYGFSWGDMLANGIGSGSAYLHNVSKERFFPQIKYSFHQTTYPLANPSLLGRSLVSQMLKDYNGQTYWVSVPGLIRKYPWMCLSVGYGATGMIRARDAQNKALGLDPHRQYYLSFDVDITRIKTQNCFLKGMFSVFRFVKIPFPALQFSKHGLRAHPLYF